MPCNYALYPSTWKLLRAEILTRAQLRCECSGQCGIHGGPTNAHRCIERHHTQAIFARGRIVLTLAHLCQCQPLCADPAHIIAACQRCHLRIDRFKHSANRATRARANKQIHLTTVLPLTT